ncbi:hypothetical protein OHC33_004338 [Knufia fluminis]|uniref:MYND-type domain-containing protein n=1 Tax=Knufia fluminis TaxID=191047 RepID=A0AAN8EVD9_9EURO|nr:hypothetical protein OHC33_004338 [Knufia fluminis]
MTTLQHSAFGPRKPVEMEVHGPRGSLRHRCSECQQPSSNLRLCTGCNVVRYCPREHQVEHRPAHKSTCSKIKKGRAKLSKEEELVRNATPDFATPANAFETSVGHFWGILSTRDYMRARFDLADSVRRVGTLDGVQEGLAYLQDMLRLCRSDNMGVRDIVPYLMLQLDQDQECYDFVKWYQTEGQRGDYDWGDMSLPFLNIRDASVWESADYLDRRFLSINHVSAIHLLKLKLLIDIRNLKIARKAPPKNVPNELVENIELAVIRSPLSIALVKQNEEELLRTEDTLLY